eukprot:1209609-Pleurochrysis_carterae.AAC.1
MHVADLNIGKQVDKHAVMRHADTYTRERIATFYKGMGAPRNTKKKPDGRVGTEWFKASQFAQMIFGGKRFPGGAPAWVPSLVLLLGECRLDTRELHAGATSRNGPPSSTASSTLQQLMNKKYGKSLAVDLLRALRSYDAYAAWRATCDLATPDEAARER